jgi:hypothetical protein
MPVFYFHIRSHDGLFLDEEGSEHASLAAAGLEAIRGARSLISAEVEAGHVRLDQSIELFDEEGQHRSTVRFEDAFRITRAGDLEPQPVVDALL